MADTWLSISRCQEVIPNFPTTDEAVIAHLIKSTVAFVERYCHRTFLPTTYDELYNGTGRANLFLKQAPVIRIDRVATNWIYAMSVRNTDSTINDASFQLTKKGAVLYRSKSGQSFTDTLLFTDNATLGDLATSINALGNGWTASALNPYADTLTSDLWTPQGAYDAFRAQAYIRHHVYRLWDFIIDENSGEIFSNFGFWKGYKNWRFTYTAGFADDDGNPAIPDDLIQAAAELVQSVYYSRQVNINLASETEGFYSYTVNETDLSSLSIPSMHTLHLYKRPQVVRFGAV